MMMACQQVVMRLKDMRDWSALQTGNFIKNYYSFNFEDSLKEIAESLKINAQYKRVKLNFEFNFRSQNEFASQI